MEKMVNNSYFDSIVKLIQQNSVLPKFCIDKCGIDLRHIIKGLKKPLNDSYIEIFLKISTVQFF